MGKFRFCLKDDACFQAFREVQREEQQRKAVKEWNKEKQIRSIEVKTKEYRQVLQAEVNKLARLIDLHFGYKCIDCGKNYGKQIDGAHFDSVGSNSSLRYNLHNIHAAKSDCNKYSPNHKTGYIKGLEDRYGQAYLTYVSEELKLEYKELKITNQEVYEALKRARKCVREFNDLVEGVENGKVARELFNELIDIYC